MRCPESLDDEVCGLGFKPSATDVEKYCSSGEKYAECPYSSGFQNAEVEDFRVSDPLLLAIQGEIEDGDL